MKAKYKMTGCARFLIFLVFLIPIAYFGSKYLRDSGTWDKIKDKVENKDNNSVERTIDEKRDRIEFPGQVSGQENDLQDQFERLKAAYEEQEILLAKQEQTVKNLRQENEALRKRLNDPLIGATNPSTTSPTQSGTPGSSGSLSLEDLLKEADNNLGTTPGPVDDTSTGQRRNILGSWSFNFSGSAGEIEFYQQDERLFSRITIQGDNSINIDQLDRSGNRFNVHNSPTGEYYVLLSDGNLEAHDQNGFQTTCTRKK